MSETVWDNIYKEYLAGGPAWATLTDDMHIGFLTFIEESTFPVKFALDIGCGQGKYLKYLQEKGFKTTGLDSSESAIKMTNDLLHNQGEFIIADMYKYQYPVSTYDLIISHATLHHGKKKNVIALLDRIYDSLMINGKIFISLPNDDCKKNWAMMAEHETLDDGTCIPVTGPEKGLPHSFYSREEIDALFSRYSNLEVYIDERGRWIITGEKSKGTFMKPIRNSVKAIIINNGKVLLTKNRDDKGFFYLFPGGGQNPGEELKNTLVRECIEEVNQEVDIGELVFIREYIGENHEFSKFDYDVHQVEFYFNCKLKSEEVNPTINNGSIPDAYQVGVEWIEISKLDTIRLYPKILANKLKDNILGPCYLGDVN